MLRSATRIAPALVRRSALRASAALIAARPFSAAVVCRATTPATAAKELASALRAEQKLEQETASEVEGGAQETLEWARSNGYEVVTVDGQEQVQLVKKVSDDETIRVFFSISDVVNAESLLDETSFAPGQDQLSEDGTPFEDAEEEDLETPVRVNIVVEKPKGALSIEATVQDDLVLVESVIPYGSAEVALEETANADYSRRQYYQGPPHGVLDPSVQSAIQEFLESRKLDGEFALFVQEYSSFRENQEYISWLGRIAEIVE